MARVATQGPALQRARRLIPNLASDVVPGAGHFVATARPDFVNPRVLAFLLATGKTQG